jgi:NAD(P)H-hydrate epimerase
MTTVRGAAVPALTAEQMRGVDRAMAEDLHIELIQMMENAGRSLAHLAIARFAPSSVTVLAGPGGNRRRRPGRRPAPDQPWAHRFSGPVRPNSLFPVPARQADILVRMGAVMAKSPTRADLIVEALIGYSLRGDPTGRAAELIGWANSQPAPVLALGTPSGLDVTTGRAGTPHIRASATLTIALPKVGLIGTSAVGELYLADISVPAIVYQRLGITPPDLFHVDAIVRLS